MRRRIRELTGAGFLLSTVFAGAGQTAADTGPGTDSPGAGDVREDTDESIERARRITGLEGWPGIRSIWRELDQVEPGPDGYSFGTMDWETAGMMREKLNSLDLEMTAVLVAEGLPTTELDMVTDITRMRLEMMSSGLPSMMTRMMPPPVEYDKGMLLEEMEGRIDHLIGLREQGLLSVEQVRSATGAVLDTFMAVAVINAVTDSYGYPYTYDFPLPRLIGDGTAAVDTVLDATGMADLVLAELEDHYRSVTEADSAVPGYTDTEDLQRRYAETIAAVAEVRGAVNGTGYLLGDLLLGAD